MPKVFNILDSFLYRTIENAAYLVNCQVDHRMSMPVAQVSSATTAAKPRLQLGLHWNFKNDVAIARSYENEYYICVVCISDLGIVN